MAICNRFNKINNEHFNIEIYDAYNAIPYSWQLLAQHDFFLQSDFLLHIETNLKNEITPIYAVLINEKKELQGIVYAQLVQFNSKFFNEEKKEDWFTTLKKKFSFFAINLANAKLLVIGNIYLTGQHGFSFQPNIDKNFWLNECINAIHKKTKSSVSIIKDLPLHKIQIDGYNPIEVQPNMIFYKQESWKTFDDYLNALNSKHRVKAKKIISKGEPIKLVKAENITEADKKRMYQLYLQMIQNASYNLSKVSESYIANLYNVKNSHIYFFKVNNEIEGFICYFTHGKNATAHYLGYNTSLNLTYNIYHNMLFALVRLSIENNIEKMYWARTALEIKSSVGAKPIATTILIRHTNSFLNYFVKKGVSFFKQDIWSERNPFK